ncbi:MAG: MBL fold metallo-hydrolase [Clostridia bacterium]|nr:MBL fold metallo-hydrolase [Clostridia bacterium]
MRVNYLGHACFLLADNQKSVVIDPFKNIGYPLKRVSADFCACSHFHFDHCATEMVDARVIINAQNTHKFDWVKTVNSYHDEVMGFKRGENLIFKFKIDQFNVCHLGDLGQPYNEELCEKIGRVDVLLIPVGSTYTIDAEEAYKYVMKLNPSIVIPMHYKTPRSTVDIEGKSLFLDMFDRVEKVCAQFEIIKLPNEMTVYDVDDSEF